MLHGSEITQSRIPLRRFPANRVYGTIARMRRLLATEIRVGEVELDDSQSHHARSVLRLTAGDSVELFDPTGQSAAGVIVRIEPRVVVRIEQLNPQATTSSIIIASAVPKGDRADWLVEKLSEIGVARFIPLRTARSVVHPDGSGKFERWRRIAEESAKQSRRPGVMEICPLTHLTDLLTQIDPSTAFLLSTDPTAQSLASQLATRNSQLTSTRNSQLLLIGPEGGWTDDEETSMRSLGLTPATLGPTILRIETAAIVAAGIVAAFSAWRSS
jgi:16S rRNA (uracil1498-N3)-methyltransferase